MKTSNIEDIKDYQTLKLMQSLVYASKVYRNKHDARYVVYDLGPTYTSRNELMSIIDAQIQRVIEEKINGTEEGVIVT